MGKRVSNEFLYSLFQSHLDGTLLG